jgi:hypothetical protein
LFHNHTHLNNYNSNSKPIITDFAAQVESFLTFPACGKMLPVTVFRFQLWQVLTAGLIGKRAPWMERTAGRRIQQAWHFTAG